MVDIEKIMMNNLWNAFNILRGYFEIEVSQKIIRELLFVKLLNDEIEKDNKYFIERIDGTLKFQDYLELPERFIDELYMFIKKNECLNGLVDEIFRIRGKLEVRLISDLLKSFVSFKNNSEMKSHTLFKYFIDSTATNSKSSGEISTPASISKFISKLLEDKSIKSLYDPAIGTGSLALEVASKHNDVKLYGQDKNLSVLNTCKMLLILDEKIEDLENIYHGDTILEPGNTIDNNLVKFDCIVCNPPYGLKEWGYNQVLDCDQYNRFKRGMPSRHVGDYAFITHVLESLNDSGVAVMIEPAGVLFREGAEGKLREQFVRENLIDSIIALPSNMMYGTTIPVNIIVFNKNKKTNDILFMDISQEVSVNKQLTTISDESINRITDIYRGKDDVEGLARVVSISEIENNNFNLMPQKYIESKCEREYLDIGSLNSDIKSLVKKLNIIQSELVEILSK